MLFVKKVGEHILLMTETLDVVKDYPDATLSVVGDTLVITSGGCTAVELPKQQVGLIYK